MDDNKPTVETYGALQQAYDFFNGKLFATTLPDCLITLQRKDKRMSGYFWGSRFEHSENDRRTDEIALNPQRFKIDGIEEVLSTLTHEMTHLWQHHYGKPSRNAYHNAEWAAKMKTVGLQPSSTGKPGGKETGQKMSDYILEGGPFSKASRELISDGFRLAWSEIADRVKTTEEEDGGEKDRSNRTKFTCSDCGANAWGKADLLLICGACDTPMQGADETPTRNKTMGNRARACKVSHQVLQYG
ncbi:MAG: SprT-like domain-containing protein [Magnetococcus sp. YQC-9]